MLSTQFDSAWDLGFACTPWAQLSMAIHQGMEGEKLLSRDGVGLEQYWKGMERTHGRQYSHDEPRLFHLHGKPICTLHGMRTI